MRWEQKAGRGQKREGGDEEQGGGARWPGRKGKARGVGNHEIQTEQHLHLSPDNDYHLHHLSPHLKLKQIGLYGKHGTLIGFEVNEEAHRGDEAASGGAP